MASWGFFCVYSILHLHLVYGLPQCGHFILLPLRPPMSHSPRTAPAHNLAVLAPSAP